MGCEIKKEEGAAWLKQASEAGSIQGLYEMACLFYTGSAEPCVEENERKAFDFFEKAAGQNHTGALYMVADLLIDGVGCEQDAARAIPLLYQAGERGHRYARQTLLQIL